MRLFSKKITTFTDPSQKVPMVVVGTKLDLVNEREVQRQTIESLSRQWDVPFYETSAKRNWHVTEVFEELLRQMRRYYPANPSRTRKKRGCIVM